MPTFNIDFLLARAEELLKDVSKTAFNLHSETAFKLQPIFNSYHYTERVSLFKTLILLLHKMNI